MRTMIVFSFFYPQSTLVGSPIAIGVFNFLCRVHRFFADRGNVANDCSDDSETLKLLHQTIKKVTSDIEGLKFNTAISQLMIFTNLAIRKGKISLDSAQTFAKLLSPFAPHLGEELWALYGGKTSISHNIWPEYSESYMKEDTFDSLNMFLF